MNTMVKNIVFSPCSCFIISLNDYNEQLNTDNIFIFALDTTGKWLFLKSFKEKTKNLDVKFTDEDRTFQCKS